MVSVTPIVGIECVRRLLLQVGGDVGDGLLVVDEHLERFWAIWVWNSATDGAGGSLPSATASMKSGGETTFSPRYSPR